MFLWRTSHSPLPIFLPPAASRNYYLAQFKVEYLQTVFGQDAFYLMYVVYNECLWPLPISSRPDSTRFCNISFLGFLTILTLHGSLANKKSLPVKGCNSHWLNYINSLIMREWKNPNTSVSTSLFGSKSHLFPTKAITKFLFPRRSKKPWAIKTKKSNIYLRSKPIEVQYDLCTPWKKRKKIIFKHHGEIAC